MNFSTQLIFDITSIATTVTLVVGVILIAIALFRIAHTLKLRNQMLQQATRPLIYCQRNDKQLLIQNIGSTPATIDQIDSELDLSHLVGQIIPSNQQFFYNMTNQQPLHIVIKYHDQLSEFQNEFDL